MIDTDPSAEQIARRALDAGHPTLDLPCREVFAYGQKAVRVIGPAPEVEAEIAALHIAFWQRNSP